MKEQVRARLSREMPDVRFSFEPSDIVNEVMSFGSPTPIEVVVSGSDFAKNREFAEKLRKQLAMVPALLDIQLVSRWTTHSANQCRSRESRPSRINASGCITCFSNCDIVEPFRGTQLLG